MPFTTPIYKLIHDRQKFYDGQNIKINIDSLKPIEARQTE